MERSPERMAEENPSIYRRILAGISMDRFRDFVDPDLPQFNRDWQLELRSLISENRDDRTIIWVYGPDGGEGKSSYARQLMKEGWFYTRGGSSDNVAYQYVGFLGKDVVFDIPRDKKDYLQYSLVEMLKDRVIVSNKYEPITAVNPGNIAVVVMSNFLPDYEKISENKVRVIYCNKENEIMK